MPASPARCLALLLAAACSARPAAGPPSVLVVVLENARADHLSAYGHLRATSPELEALARAGVLFEDCTAPGSWTWPSHVSLFTGELPTAHGAQLASMQPHASGSVHDSIPVPLERDVPTLAEAFGRAGYTTIAVSSDDWLAPELGLTRGFARSEIAASDDDAVARAASALEEGSSLPVLLWLDLSGARSPRQETAHSWIAPHAALLDPAHAPEWLEPYLVPGTPRAVDLDENYGGAALSGNERFLLGMLEIPPEGLELLQDLYDGELADADARLGRIVARFRRAHPDGIIAVTSDHGELLGERGLLGHSGHVYPEVVHVPLVIAAPGRLPAGRRVHTPVPLHELYATLLDLAQLGRRADSLVPVVEGAQRNEPIAAIAFRDPDAARLLGGRFRHTWALFRRGDEALVFSSGGDLELYDVATDPGMRTSLTQARGGRADALRREAEQFFAGAIEPLPEEPPIADGTDVAHLP